MSRLFSHPDYAEDQPFGHTILALHALSRGFALGAGAGSAIHLVRRLVRPGASPPSLLASSGTGALVGTGLLALGLLGRMRGREEIEWKDRSWRLLWNRGQKEVDDWLVAGAVLGAAGVVVVARRELRGLGARAVIGGMGLGGLAGMLGQSAWRYGIRGGFEEEKVV